MIISRREFYRRCSMCPFKVIREADEVMSVERLFAELQMDAPFRNHAYFFDKAVDFDHLPLQEETVGIKEQFPEISTEGERFAKIRAEIEHDTYRPVPVLCDIDYPCVIYLDDGLHRVFAAHQLGLKFMRVHVQYGKFMLSNSLSFRDIASLLDMLVRLFGDSHPTVAGLRDFMNRIVEKRPDIADTHSVTFGHEKGTDDSYRAEVIIK